MQKNLDFMLDLVPSSNDPPAFDSLYQLELQAFSSRIRNGTRLVVRQDSIGAAGDFLRFVFENAGHLIDAVAAVAAAYVNSKAGRTVRVKLKDCEVEARTIDEVKELLEFIRTLRDDDDEQ